MTTGGWVFMTVSVTGVIILLVYCYRRILTAPVDRTTKPPDMLGG